MKRLLTISIVTSINLLTIAQNTDKRLNLDTLHLTDNQNFTGKIRKFGAFKVKIFSLEKADSKKMIFRIPYYRVAGISQNAFDKRGRTLEQTLKQAKQNTRSAIGIGSINAGVNLFYDMPIKETQSVNFRFSIGSVGYLIRQEEFSLNYEKQVTTTYVYNGFNTHAYQTTSLYSPEGSYDVLYNGRYTHKRAKINFFLDFEPRFYWTGRKSIVKPYSGLILGLNSSSYFYLDYHETHRSTTTTSNTSTVHSEIYVTGKEVSIYRPHVGSSIGVEVYFGRKLSLGTGYKILATRGPKDKVQERFTFYDQYYNVKYSIQTKFQFNHFVNHLLTIDIKYLLEDRLSKKTKN